MTFEELLAEHAALTGEVQRSQEALKIALLTIERMKVELTYLRRMKFGRSSEKLEHDQLELVGGQTGQPSPLTTTPDTGKVSSIATARKKREAAKRPGLRELPEHLPRRTVLHTPQGGCNCEACGRGLREIGQDVSEVLDYEPGSFHVVRHVRPKLACAGCKTISQAPAADRPIERGLAGAGLFAHILVSKYADHTPLYRQCQIYAREGVEAACWSHARRKMWDIHERQHQLPGTLAHQALDRIGEVFKVEAEIRGQPPDERRRVRQQRTRPALVELKTWLSSTFAQLSAKSPMALAIGYSMSNWTALTRFVDDGRIEAHNNAAERALRSVALGRKNYLHLGSDVGGQSAAVIYTLLGTARLNAINPALYLRHVLERIADHPSTRIDELLPWVVAPQLRAAWQEPIVQAA